MRTNIKMPHLTNIGISRGKFLAFLEISRHPDGISVGDVSEKIGETPQLVMYAIKSLEKNNYIKTVFEERNGKGRRICYATPFGIDVVQKEMESVCRLLSEIRKEVIKRG